MYLKRLELQGFKSFADKTVLEFMPGITTVIGPNGSGKSNISDAIRWVLGEQSLKSLRGTKAEDIIFAGTESRKSLGFAEASIVIDNTDGKLPIEYSEVTVTRKVYRTGETGYFINKTPCRLKDILELFMDTGIGKDGYSIIGQGKIDEILSNKSEDRRHIFEEAAGIVKYRVRKLESEKKLEQTKLNLLRINDILSEVEANLEPLKVQSEKAKKFLDLREELKNIEVGLFLYNIESYNQKLEEIQKDIQVYLDQSQLEEEKKESLRKNKEELKVKLDEISSQIEYVQNLSFEGTNTIEKYNSQINVAKEKIENNKQNSQRYLQEIEDIKLKIEELETEKKNKIERKATISDDKERFENELKQKEQELEEKMAKLTDKEKQIEDKKQKVAELTDNKYEMITQSNTFDATTENIVKRQKSLKDEITSLISELDSSRLTKEEISKNFYEIESKKNNISSQIEKVSSKKEESVKKINQYEQKINELSSNLRIQESRLNFLIQTEKEKEGYSKSIKSIISACEKDANLATGMEGTLANLISVKKEYQTAIEMCLGASLQNIVTKTEQDAKKLIEFLRKNDLGRASFLPISSVKGKKLERLIRNGINGIIGIAADLVQTDEKYKDIILNLLGRTVIVDNMDTAIILAKQNNYSFRIVTLKGDLINPSGAISGGSVAQKTGGILGRAKEIESLKVEVQNLKKQVEKIQKEKAEYESSIEDILELSSNLDKQLQEIEIEYATQKQKVVLVEENIEKLQTRLEKLKQEQQELQAGQEQIKKDKDDLQIKQKELEDSILELTTSINSYAELNKDEQKYIDDLNFEITNLKISLSSFDESNLSIDEMVERIEKDIESSNQNIVNKEQEIENLKVEDETLQQEIENVNNQIAELKDTIQNSSSKIDELKQQKTETNDQLEKIENDILEQFKQIEDLKAQISKTEVKKSKIDVELEQIINKLWEEYELTPNNAKEYSKPENPTATQKKVNTLRNQIRDLGSINIDSIEEYKQTKQRYDFMCEQRLDLENTSSKLKKVIQDMTNIMKEQFEKQFRIINKNFNEVFKELFDGGKGELILTDENDILQSGIEIHVQPPGKKLQNMLALSGGEKALTAIALLFAILKINPAPFCVLDEIEAALDDVNVYRFADYLKKFIAKTQFLVITHRKGTMEAADTVYGITMEQSGISKLLSMKLK